MSKKLVLALILFSVMISIPWIWIYRTYDGLENIPHEDLQMWIFMINYAILAALMLAAILAGFQTEPPAAAQLKPEKNGIEHLHQMEPTDEKAAAAIRKEKAAEEQVISEEEAPAELQEEPPEEWAEENYE